jgi:hypothetical protein
MMVGESDGGPVTVGVVAVTVGVVAVGAGVAVVSITGTWVLTAGAFARCR